MTMTIVFVGIDLAKNGFLLHGVHEVAACLQADIEMELAHIDAGIELDRAVRYPTLLMHVHDLQLFGLHEWMKRADALTLC